MTKYCEGISPLFSILFNINITIFTVALGHSGICLSQRLLFLPRPFSQLFGVGLPCASLYSYSYFVLSYLDKEIGWLYYFTAGYHLTPRVTLVEGLAAAIDPKVLPASPLLSTPSSTQHVCNLD